MTKAPPPPPHPRLTPQALAAIYAHARQDHPKECCGIVFGPRETASAERAVACANIQDRLHAEDPARHVRDARTAYNLDAGDLFKLQKSLRGAEPAKIVYHSHVDIDGDGAYFSATDQAVAQLDGVLPMDTDEAWDVAARLAKEEGLLVGHSSGASLAGALRIARPLAADGKTGVVVTLFPDRADRYFEAPVATQTPRPRP